MKGLSWKNWCLLVLAVVVVAIAAAYAAGLVPYRVYAVRTGSMAPSIPSKSAVIVREGQYKVGEPIAFVANGEMTTHRLMSINADGIVTTKGDANRSEDPWHVPTTNIIGGVVAAPPYAGWLLVYLLYTPTGGLSVLLLLSCFWQVNRLAKTFA